MKCGQWIQYVDANGKGWAQPDAFVLTEAFVLLFEAKLTQTETAAVQMFGLYVPLLKFLYRKPVLCCQVTKNLRDPVNTILCPEEMEKRPGFKPYLWHFLGN